MEKISSRRDFSGGLANRLTAGTSISPASMAKAPQLMGERSSAGKIDGISIFNTMIPAPKRKLTQQAALVVRFQYSPYKKES